MRRAPVLVLSAFLLLCCHQRQPKTSDAQMQKLRAAGLTANCLEKIRWGGVEALKPDEDCSKRLPSAHWRGLWRNDFEGSLFCPEPAQECANSMKPRSGSIWFELEPRPAAVANEPPGGLYAVEFIGRRTAQGSPFKAYGYDEDIVVDRLISIRKIEAPPK